MTYKSIIISDLDGVLIDSSHRYRARDGKIDLAHWRAHDNDAYIWQDKITPLVKRINHLFDTGHYIILATARACDYQDVNYQFIKFHGLKHHKFVHRQGVDDNRGGAILKIQAVKPLLNLKPFHDLPVHIFEDNIKYLHTMKAAFSANGRRVVPHYIPSVQGH